VLSMLVQGGKKLTCLVSGALSHMNFKDWAPAHGK